MQKKIKLQPYIALCRLEKPIGILLLLWPTLWALWLAAHGKPKMDTLIIFTLGVIIMRSAGCVINDIIDRHLDRHVERTQQRPLTSGAISLTAALMLFFILITLAFILVLQLNTLCLGLAIIGFILTCCYPFTKRCISLPQGFLGLTFAWGIPMSYAATLNQLPLNCWLLYLANILWVMAYDTQYAMVDKQDDIKIGVRSSAILFGSWDRLIIATLQLTSLLLLVILGQRQSLTWPFYAGLFFSSLLMGYQHCLIATRQPQRCFQAFLNNHWIGLVIFIGLTISLT